MKCHGSCILGRISSADVKLLGSGLASSSVVVGSIQLQIDDGWLLAQQQVEQNLEQAYVFRGTEWQESCFRAEKMVGMLASEFL